jgi:FkbM family methyltransferase
MNLTPPFVARLFPSDALITRIVRPAINRLAGTGPTVAVVRRGSGAGLRLVLDPRNEKFYWTGLYEREVQIELVALAKPGSVVWDIGAHIGFFSLIAARSVGASGSVHAFEPLEETRVRLAENIAMNRMANVVIHPVAVSNQRGSRTLNRHVYSSMWSLIPERPDQTGVVVDCETMDGLAERIGIPDIVKIDVEGAELDVLRGGLDLLGRGSTSFIVEMTGPDFVREALALLPFWSFRQLSPRHWLIRK